MSSSFAPPGRWSPVAFQTLTASPMNPAPFARDAATDGDPLVHQRRERDPPPLADVAEPLLVGDADVGEVHLVELGLTGDLVERAHLDAGRLHVDHEVGHALVLRLVGVGAGDEHPPLGEVGERGPDLLAVDDPLVAVAHAPSVARPATSEPAPGSENSWHHISSPVNSGRR